MTHRHTRAALRTREWYVYVDVRARELTHATVEVAVWCYEDWHEVHKRGRRSLQGLARHPNFAGIVIQDIGKIRCPRCDYKITDVHRGSTDFGTGIFSAR